MLSALWWSQISKVNWKLDLCIELPWGKVFWRARKTIPILSWEMQITFWIETLWRSITTLMSGLVMMQSIYFPLCAIEKKKKKKTILLRKLLWPDRFKFKRKFDFQLSFTFKISECIIFQTARKWLNPLTSKQNLLTLGKSNSTLYLKISIHLPDFRPEWKSLTDLSTALYHSVFEKK